PFRVEDQAEALEPIELDFTWRRRPEDEEEDVDMIPLIDVSLVLLIFFMMTTTAAPVAAFAVNTPQAHPAVLATTPDLVWTGLDCKRDDRGQKDPHKLIFAVGQGEQQVDWKSDQEPQWKDGVPDTETKGAIDRILGVIQQKPGLVEVNIRGDQEVPSGHI